MPAASLGGTHREVEHCRLRVPTARQERAQVFDRVRPRLAARERVDTPCCPLGRLSTASRPALRVAVLADGGRGRYRVGARARVRRPLVVGTVRTTALRCDCVESERRVAGGRLSARVGAVAVMLDLEALCSSASPVRYTRAAGVVNRPCPAQTGSQPSPRASRQGG